MSQVWSEINKVTNVLDLKNQSDTASAEIPCDIVHLENYKKLTYLITLGSSGVKNWPTITVLAGETSTGATTAIPFRYRTQLTGTDGSTGSIGSDVPSALTTGTSFTFTSGGGGMYIVEVDPSIVASKTSTGDSYDHVKLLFTNATTGNAQIYGALAILSEPRYPQAILQTAID